MSVVVGVRLCVVAVEFPTVDATVEVVDAMVVVVVETSSHVLLSVSIKPASHWHTPVALQDAFPVQVSMVDVVGILSVVLSIGDIVLVVIFPVDNVQFSPTAERAEMEIRIVYFKEKTIHLFTSLPLVSLIVFCTNNQLKWIRSSHNMFRSWVTVSVPTV